MPMKSGLRLVGRVCITDSVWESLGTGWSFEGIGACWMIMQIVCIVFRDNPELIWQAS